MTQGRPVCVVIAAHDAARTIGAAVASALAEPEVGAVIVVDDASADDTGAIAAAAADGDTRLKVITQPANGGPAAARNAAIAATDAPFIAILDADDAVLPGRFGALLAAGDWDMIADNILFVGEDAAGDMVAPDMRPASGCDAAPLTLAEFVAGNISGGAHRGELGFLKPLIRREILVRDSLQYDTGMRLGEDYDLYVRALQHGARFGVTRRVGYLARVRATSLSAQHATADLRALRDACDRHIACADDAALTEMRRHRRQIHNRYLLRAFLDAKGGAGMKAALSLALRPPSNFAPIAWGVVSDKWRARFAAPAVTSPVGRTLLPV